MWKYASISDWTMSCNLKQAQTRNKREFYNVLELIDPEGRHRGHLAAAQKEACFYYVWGMEATIIMLHTMHNVN